MKFDIEINKIIEDFNIYPQHQTAPSTGPDIGMTSGDIQNTFPSKQKSINLKLPKKIKKKLKKAQ